MTLSLPRPPEHEALLASLGLTLASLRHAEGVVRRHFPPTPLLPAPRLSRALGQDLWLKLEGVVPTRSFKLRGALAKVDALDRLHDHCGLITASAGNHGLAVAWAARASGRTAVVCVPRSANPQKVEGIAALGAVLDIGGRDYQEAQERAEKRAEAEGLSLVHAYNDLDVILGQGTLGLELAEQGPFHRVLLGVGGGGLLSGVAAALAFTDSNAQVIGVEPQGADALVRTLETGHPVQLTSIKTVADGLGASQAGDLPLAVLRATGAHALRVSDDDLRRAMSLLLREERIIAEAAGVAGLAALLKPHSPRNGGRTVVVISGANIADTDLTRTCAEVAAS